MTAHFAAQMACFGWPADCYYTEVTITAKRTMTRPTHPATQLWYSHRGGATATGLAVRTGRLHAEFAGGSTSLRALEEAASRDIRLAYYHHGQTGLLREGGNIPAIWARSQNQNAVVVGITWVDEFQAIFVRRDSKLRELADLARKRIGLPLRRRALIDIGRAGAQKGFATALVAAGLDPLRARWTHIESPDFEFPQHHGDRELETSALLSGYVDAIFLRGAQAVAARRNPGLRVLARLDELDVPFATVSNGTPRPITVDRDFLARHPEVVQRYLGVLLRTADWASANLQDAARLIALDVPGYPAELVLEALGPGMHHKLAPVISTRHHDALGAQKDFLLEWGFIRKDFSIEEWTDPLPLAAAQRWRHVQPPESALVVPELSASN